MSTNTTSNRNSLSSPFSKFKSPKVEESCPPYVHLQGFHPAQLPAPNATVDELKPLLESILSEGLEFFVNLPPHDAPSSSSSTWNFLDSKYFTNSHGAVHVYERTVSAMDLKSRAKTVTITPELAKTLPETWFLRRSVHQNDAVTGSAAWDEFAKCFKKDHAKYEREFTPTVTETYLVDAWDLSGLEAEVDGQTWDNFTLKREESLHSMPFPLKTRVFPVLQLTASVKSKKEFVVVQISVRDSGAEARRKGKVFRGAYTSVERVRELDDGQIEWVMGTTSTARGMIPEWVQKKAIPGVVAKDVDMFMRWIGRERKDNNVIML